MSDTQRPLEEFDADPSGEADEEDLFATVHGMGWTPADFSEAEVAERYAAWLEKEKDNPDSDL